MVGMWGSMFTPSLGYLHLQIEKKKKKSSAVRFKFRFLKVARSNKNFSEIEKLVVKTK